MFIDETHSSLRPIISRTWAGVGCTPMVKVSGKRDGVTIIGGLTEAGRIIALQTQDSMNCLGFIEFLKHALNEVTGKLVVFADNHRMHQTPLVLKFVKDNEERLALEFTPCYAPECNPIEWVWAWVKKLLAMRCLGSVGALLEFWGKALMLGELQGLLVGFWGASAIGKCYQRTNA